MAGVGTAAFDALQASWNATQVHKIGNVPQSPITPYIVVTTSSGSAENYDQAAQYGTRSYRVVVQAIGSTDGETDSATSRADTALLDRRLLVAGYDLTPCEIETSSQAIRDPDGGSLLSRTLTYTFTATRTETP